MIEFILYILGLLIVGFIAGVSYADCDNEKLQKKIQEYNISIKDGTVG